MRRTIVLSLLAAACGTLEVDSVDGGGALDGGRDVEAGPTPDVDGGPACDPAKAFDPPVRVPSASSSSPDVGAWLSGTQLFVARDLGPTSAIWVYSSDGVTFGSPTAIDLSNTTTASSPTLSASGTTMYYHFYDPAGASGIGRATRASPDTNVFTVGPPLAITPAPEAVLHPRLWGDELWFSIEAGGQWVLHRMLVSEDSIGTPMPVSELHDSTSFDEFSAVLTKDRLRVYYQRQKTADSTSDVWTATRLQTGVPFENAARVPELSTTNVQAPTWLSDDGCTMYLGAAAPDTDVYVAKKPR